VNVLTQYSCGEHILIIGIYTFTCWQETRVEGCPGKICHARERQSDFDSKQTFLSVNILKM